MIRYKEQDSHNFCVSLSDQWAMNVAAIYIDNLIDAFYGRNEKAQKAVKNALEEELIEEMYRMIL